ncbi:MAG: Histidine biosynthesis bifunctional protein HisB [bacterium]|nr:Histidine biosynthesis bifunctional protein HisB [bacterium]
MRMRSYNAATQQTGQASGGHPLVREPLTRPQRWGSSQASGSRRAVFIDRDGVLNRLIIQGYVRHPNELEVIPEALEGVRRLAQESDYQLVLFTNQSVVGRGDITRSQLDQIHEHLLELIEAAGGRVDLLQICPHAPFLQCDCRKPRPGMLHEAAELLNLDLSQSWVVGDSVRDMQAGRAAGTRLAFIRYQGWHDEREWDRLIAESHAVDVICEHLLEAASFILADDQVAVR